MFPEDIEQMARFLGRDDPAVQRLLKVYVRNPKMAETVRNLLKRRCAQAGYDPDDPPVFWPVRELPPGLVTLGQVVQGTMPGPVFSLPKGVLTQHVGMFGQTGTGKSFLAMHLASETIRAGHRVWILDLEDEYTRLLPSLPAGALLPLEPEHLRINFFQPPGPWVSPAQWLGELSLLLRGQTFLRDGSLNLFRTGMGKLLVRKGVTVGGTDWPSLVETIEHFRGMPFGPKSRNMGFLESLLNRLGGLADVFGQMARVMNSHSLSTLAQRSVIFRLHSLTGVPLQFLVSFLLLWLARYQEGAPQDGRIHVVIIEEAHMLASERSRIDIGENILCRTFRTARKRGIALVVCDQVPSELAPAVLGNLGCRVVMRLVNARCVWSLQSSMGLRRDQAETIPELQRREAVAQYELYRTPFMVKVPELAFPDKPGEQELRRQAEAVLAQTEWSEYLPEPGRAAPLLVATALGPDELAGDALFVMTRICGSPADSIDERCQVLRMDRAREFRARGELDGRGLIAQVPQTIGGKIKFFRPTDKGIAWAERHKIRVKKFKSGIVHEYLLTEVERHIGAVGPGWRLQRNSSIARDQGLQPDLLVLGPEGERIIVEVCCNNLDYDAENILAEAVIPDVDRVVAVTPDRRTMDGLCEALKKAPVSSQRDWRTSVTVLQAAKCLAPAFDWAGLLARKNSRGTASAAEA